MTQQQANKMQEESKKMKGEPSSSYPPPSNPFQPQQQLPGNQGQVASSWVPQQHVKQEVPTTGYSGNFSFQPAVSYNSTYQSYYN